MSKLEREVHALVTPVLLRLSRLDPLVASAELEPPGGELRESCRRPRRERRAVVAANRFRQAELAEDLEKSAPDASGAGVRECDAGDEVAAEGIGHGERVAAGLADQEVALEVDAPERVGGLGVGERAGRGRRPMTAAARHDEAVSLEDQGEGADRKGARPWGWRA